MRKKAFTLAELLIALGIVGVIAALTLPSLMNMKQEATAGPQLSKVKASVEDAASRILLEDPSKNLKAYNTDFTGKMSEYLVLSIAEGGGYRLKDGVVIDFAEPDPDPKKSVVSNASGSAFKKVNVDLNGMSKPNVAGVDKFEFLLSTQGLLVPQGCAAKLASNNWKVSKDYDSATCTSYTMGDAIADIKNDEGEDYVPNVPVICADGAVLPPGLSCSCTNICTELQSQNPTTCECVTDKHKCDNGDILPLNTLCPSILVEQEDCGPCGHWDSYFKTCVKVISSCSYGSSWNDQTCQCDPIPGACNAWESMQCSLTPNHTWDDATCSCVGIYVEPSCKEEDCGCGYWDAKNCRCVKVWSSCPYGQTWDESTCGCVGNEDPGPDPEPEPEPEPEPCSDPGTCGCGTWDSVNCKCIPATTTCSGCAKWDSKTCSCKEPTKSCSSGQEWDDSTCSCVTTTCSDPGTCGCGTWDSVNCKCIPASKKCSGCGVWDESTCSCTPPNTKCSGCNKWDSSTCSCQPMDTSCPVGYEWSMGTCSCDAKTNNNDKVNGGPVGMFGIDPGIKNPDLQGQIGKDGSEAMLDAGFERKE